MTSTESIIKNKKKTSWKKNNNLNNIKQWQEELTVRKKVFRHGSTQDKWTHLTS